MAHAMPKDEKPPYFPFERGKKINLDRYIAENLQPTQEFNERCNRNVDALATFLKETSKLKFDQVFKGGSLGKGTAVRDNCDLDLTVFVNGYSNIDEYKNALPGILKQLQTELREWESPDFDVSVQNKVSRYLVKISLIDKNENELKVDIVPTFARRGDLDFIHKEMAEQTEETREYYSSHFTPRQTQLIKALPPKVKNLIRIVKHWSKTYVAPYASNERRPIPASYCYELLVKFYWEQAGRPVNFSTKQGFKAIMERLEHPERINVTYDGARVDQKENLPCIVDPANPFANVAKSYDWSEELMKRASETIRSLVFQDVVVQHNWTC